MSDKYCKIISHGAPYSGEMWPVDDCPYCQIDSLTKQVEELKAEANNNKKRWLEWSESDQMKIADLEQQLGEAERLLAEANGAVSHLEVLYNHESEQRSRIEKELAEAREEIAVKQRVLDEHYGVAAICNELVNDNAALESKLQIAEEALEMIYGVRDEDGSYASLLAREALGKMQSETLAKTNTPE